MNTDHDRLNILAPRAIKPKFDYLHREVLHAAGRPLTRRQALGLGGMALFAAACGSTTTTGGGSAKSSTASANPLAGKPLENHLEIYNWSEYDDPSTYTKFKKLPAEAKAGLTLHETYYSSNDELLAKLHAGGTSYDILVPSQNAVAELIEEKRLMQLDKALLPNLKNLDPSFLKPSYDPTGDYHVLKDFGITMFFFNNKIVTDELKTMHDFYMALPKYKSKGRTNLLDGAEEVVPLALMALGLDPNTTSQSDFSQVKSFLLSVRKGVTTIDASAYIDDAIAGKIILGQGWNGDVRRIVQGRAKQGDMIGVIPTEASEIWADNWCIPASAPHPVAAHAWINWLLTPSTAVTEMNYHNYKIPMPAALDRLSADLKNDPMFNVPKTYTDNYHYILNVSPQVVQARTQIYTEFKAA
ncbi:MAG TPA: spermidine/putrescine ABC transporter substrate-binding protein [Streptosporangiaceae bacterium]|jgi:spermidine/putrescine transport system substrate-binding protein|nr:spermidine/putrescine ABC transporter substrate-binding protein [Streptosporangiaceae bacterium]